MILLGATFYTVASLLLFCLALGRHLPSVGATAPTFLTMDEYDELLQSQGLLDVTDTGDEVESRYDIVEEMGDEVDSINDVGVIADVPVDVYCNFHDDNNGLCVSKELGGDFTDIFMYNSTGSSESVITRSCEVATYPSITTQVRMKKMKSSHSASALDKLKNKLGKAVDKIRFSVVEAPHDIHLIVLSCDIDQPTIDFTTSILYQSDTPKDRRPNSFNLVFRGTIEDQQRKYTFERIHARDFPYQEHTSYKSTDPRYLARFSSRESMRRKRSWYNFFDGDKRITMKIASKVSTATEHYTSYSWNSSEYGRGTAFTFALPSYSKKRLSEKRFLRAMAAYYRGKWTVLRSY